MIVDDEAPEVFSKESYQISVDDAYRMFNASNFEPFTTSKTIKAATKEYIQGIQKIPAQAQAIMGQVAISKGQKIKELGNLVDKVLPEGNVIFNGKSLVNVGNKIQEMGMVNIRTANRNLEEFNKQARKAIPTLTEEERESWTYNIAQGGLNYGTMLGLSVVNPELGLGYISAITMGSETEEGLETYKRKHGGSLEGYEKQATQDLAFNTANTAVQTILERAFGVPAQLKFFKDKKQLLKIGLGGFAEEFATENIQNITDAVADALNGRFEGVYDKDGNPMTVLAAVMEQMKGTIVAGMFGGSAGVSFAVYNRAVTKNMIRDNIRDKVEPENLEKTVNSVYDLAATMEENAVAQETENTSSLRAKRGEVFENLYNSALQAVNDARAKGAFPELETEEDVANYVQSESKLFADWVLEEANRRNTTTQNVLDASTIQYRDGKLEIGMTKGVTSEERTLYQFIGERAESIDFGKLSMAEELEANGLSNEQIRQQTGWFRGADGKWRFEISDKEATFKDEDFIKSKATPTQDGFTIRLADMLEHDKLYKAYPQLKDAIVEVTSKDIPEKAYQDGNRFVINQNKVTVRNGLGILMHEIQHYIQGVEGFARGGSPYEFIDEEWYNNAKQEVKELEKRAKAGENVRKELSQKRAEIRQAEKYANQEYRRLGGEYEAEATRKRRTFSEERRMKEAPIRRKDLTIIMGETGKASSYTEEVPTTNIYGATNSNEEPIANPSNFNKFIEGSRVTENDEPVSPQNPPKKIYRGDTRYFEKYEPQENAYEYDWGKGFYLSDDYEDVAENYQSGGADLTNRIDREAEQYAEDNDISYEEAREKVREQYEKGDIIREFYLSIKEPVIIGGEKETFFDYTEEYDEETDEYGEPQGKLLDLIYGIENYLADIGADDYTQAITGKLYEQAIENGGLSASQVEDIVRGTEEANYLIDYESSSGEMLSSVFGSIGFDGIIDHRAGTKFKGMNMNPDTTHYVVFNSEQAKSVDNKGEWGVEEKSFYHQDERAMIQFKPDRALLSLTEKADSAGIPHELAHYYLQNMFLFAKSGKASQEYMDYYNKIAEYLDISQDQETIQEWQQEKWARAYELYRQGRTPEGLEAPMNQYNRWIRKAYGKMQEPMYQDKDGKMVVPEIDFDTMKTFAELAGEELTESQFKENQERVRGLAKSTNEMAKAKGIETELPTYEKRSSTEMGKKADEFIKKDKQLAIDIVKGLKPEQEGIFRQDLYSALRELALNEGDSDLLNELSRSMTVEEATELGQRIQALSRGRIDPVKQMVELRDERMKKNKTDKKKVKEETEKATKEIKKEIAEAATPKEWADFIKSLEC